MHDEGYVILPRRRGLAVIAATSTGLFYGAQTVKQLVIRQRQRSADSQTATIRDWPALPHRGLDDDLSRGPVPTLEFQKRQVRTLAAYKLNIYSPYFEHTLAYSASPLIAPPGGSMSPADVAELVALRRAIPRHRRAGAGGLRPSPPRPQVRAVLRSSPKRRTARCSRPCSPARSRSSSSWFTQIAQQFPSPWVHIGADETNELGKGQTKDLVAQRGLDQVYVDFLRQIHDAIQPTGKRILFWGDLAWHNPDLLSALPKDMIGVPWVYDAQARFR